MEFSRYRQYFITHKVQANRRGSRSIEEECSDSLTNVSTKFVPRISLREDIFRKAFGTKTSVGLLCNFKNQLVHIWL